MAEGPRIVYRLAKTCPHVLATLCATAGLLLAAPVHPVSAAVGLVGFPFRRVESKKKTAGL